MTLKIGDKAPEFEGKVSENKTIRLSDFLGKSNVVLYFYPKDNSFGCTREACRFRDEVEDFAKLDAVIIGVNRGSLESHRKFREKRSLPFEIISDDGGKIYKMYDVKTGIIGERVTYVIDGNGSIRGLYNSQMSYFEHPVEARKILETIKQ
ncbi:MAG: peroxiredoxin [Cuniculiplasma sp.]